ncbi:MAG: hypothetical protein Q9N68_05025, partial [Gammaproteobacteria bacterium]|nr:hypothetical protein [Gammaproteobacteria bacterium]
MARSSTHLSAQKNPFSGKFSAKDLGAVPYLSRDRLLHYMRRQSKKRYVVALQGQPGQGKSVLAAQYLAMFDCAFVWCAMDKADQEPQQLLFSLLSACCYGLDRFECAHLEDIFRSESVLDLRYAVSLLLAALDQHIGKDLYLVLDDFHHLAAAPESLEVIQNLLDGASDRIHIMLLSRLNVVDFLGSALEKSNALLINNQQLSFYLGEIQELHVANFNQYLSEDECKVLLRYTHGWPVGVDFYAQHFEESQLSYQDLIEQNYVGQGFFDYLKTTAFDWLSEEMRQFSLEIAYLDRVTPEMAKVISGRTDAESLLQELLSQHGFIKPPLMGRESYSLLPIWGAFLREKSVSLFQDDYGDALYLRLVHFWEGKGEHEKAIVCCLKAKKPQEVDVIFEQNAAIFLDQESSPELRLVLMALDERVVKRSPWISLLYANEIMMKQPERAYTYFQLAR